MSSGGDRPAAATVPMAQEDPILRQYPLRRQRIPMGPGTLSVVLPDDRKWLRGGSWVGGVAARGEPPYWISVWPAAVTLARALSRSGGLVGLNVLDLGCGVGIPGIVAAGLGATVHFVDREPHALAFARWNAERQPDCRATVTVQQLDWSRQAVSKTFDLILLSDVSYHENHHGPLRRQLAAAAGPATALLHADPERALAQRFLELLEREDGFATRRQVVDSHYRDLAAVNEGRRVPVRLTLASKSASSIDDWQRRLRWPSVGTASNAGGRS